MADAANEGIRSVRVLVVDDNESFAQMLASVLGQHETIEVIGRAADGRVAVELCRALRPDVVLMDLEMPVMNGLEATVELAAAGVRVVILTGSSRMDDDIRAAEAGAVELLRKDAPVARVAEAVLAAAA